MPAEVTVVAESSQAEEYRDMLEGMFDCICTLARPGETLLHMRQKNPPALILYLEKGGSIQEFNVLKNCMPNAKFLFIERGDNPNGPEGVPPNEVAMWSTFREKIFAETLLPEKRGVPC